MIPNRPSWKAALVVITGIVPPLGLIVAGWSWRRNRRRLALLGLLVSLLFCLVYGWLYYDRYSPLPYAQTYGNLQPQKLSVTSSNGRPGAAMSYTVPSGFKPSNTKLSAVKRFNYQVKRGDRSAVIASLYTAVIPVTPIEVADNLPKVTDGLKQPAGSKAYKAAAMPITSFTQGWLPKDVKTKLSVARPYTMAGLNGHAWTFDVTGESSDKNTPHWQGQSLYVWGQNAVYYLTIASISQNWQANQGVWQQVINSVKVE